MATLSELLRAVAVDYRILAGEVGLGREVNRIVRAGHPGDLLSAPGDGDLVVDTTVDEATPTIEARERRLHALLLGFRLSGLLTDVQPTPAVCSAARTSNTPLILLSACAGPQTLVGSLQHAVAASTSRLSQAQVYLQQDLDDLVRVGAGRAMVLQRLVEITGKTGVVQGRTALADEIRLAARQDLDSKTLRLAINSTQPDVETWMRDVADEAIANVLYWEVPAYQLVRLVAPVWIDGWTKAAVSLFARPDELTSRDRVALFHASQALAGLPPEAVVGVAPTQLRTCSPVAVMAIRSRHSHPDAIAGAIPQSLDLRQGGLVHGREDVRVWLPYDSVDAWNLLVQQTHAQLSASLGPVSLGHTFQRSGRRGAMASALVQAAEAALIAERLFGPGHITSYAEAQLARLLLERSEAADLNAIYERALGELALEDPRRDNGLLRTLEIYCETLVTIRTAERLGVHRNTVMHRIKRIEEITATDLEDSPTRLVFQLGLLADRLLRKIGSITELDPPLTLSGIGPR